MPADVILGAQWGDEGKGKIIDVLADNYDIVCRYQGGANAGHTVVVNNQKYVLHLLPSGILHKDKLNIIGNGVVIELEELIKEIETLRERGVKITSKNLIVSENAHIVLPYHKILDSAKETKSGDKKIGTTSRGIGPAYTDKYSRIGIRIRDIFDNEKLLNKIKNNLNEKNFIIKNYYGLNELSVREIYESILKQREYIKPFVGDVSYILNNALKKNKKVLFEGAQGALLDIDFGTYPYVTSSNPTIGGVIVGAGISHKYIKRVIGITKAYQTRVGGGPFPTEMEDDLQKKTREKGGEYGATTGRPRRCGWLDLVALKYVVDISGLTEIFLTKIDVLSMFEKIKVCVKYEYKGKKQDAFIPDGEELYKVRPVYVELTGWMQDISGIKSFKKLPIEAKKYIKLIEDYIDIPVTKISVGPDRNQIFNKK
ncbi:MAG: adenylosuccinate synthase [Candidatus Goldbacteria bacterium]|nr:adenylosuccinate synthase [Candidatus Goldiibacteriota bacterium]